MGVLDRFRGGGDEEEGRDRVPVDEVRSLSQDGYSNDEITEELRNRGYGYSEINEAINQAVQNQTVEGRDREQRKQEIQQSASRGEGLEQRELDQSRDRGSQGGDADRFEDRGRDQPREPDAGSTADADFGTPPGVSVREEELIETIVAEHFTEVEDEFRNIYEGLDELFETVDDLQDRVEELEIREDEDEEEFMQKVEEMEDYLLESQSRIGGMEKTMQQVLPELVENVRELSSVVEDMKEE